MATGFQNRRDVAEEATVVGIDVGGERKGFHAVALLPAGAAAARQFHNAQEVVQWCSDLRVKSIGIDAPCRWSVTGRARKAERDLAARHIHSFATPSRRVGESHAFYRWMRNGAELYRQLQARYALFRGDQGQDGPFCFETFPHAIASALRRDGQVSAKQKRLIRRQLLQAASIDTSRLSNIDWLDAALCALAARYLLAGQADAYGDDVEGWIVVPRRSSMKMPAA